MQTITITAAEALRKLKILRNEIDQEIGTADFFPKVAMVVKTESGDEKQQIKDQQQIIQNNLNSVMEKIQYYSAMKSALVKSNAMTQISFNYFGKEMRMSLAELIDFKNSIHDNFNYLVKKVCGSFVQANTKMLKQKEQILVESEKYATSVLGSVGISDPSKEDLEKYKSIYSDSREVVLIQAKNQENQFELFLEECKDFTSEIDFLINKINIETEITFSY